MLLKELPAILDGSAKTNATEQDSSLATLAPKVIALLGYVERITTKFQMLGSMSYEYFG